MLWCEPAQPLSPEDIDDPRALACRWIIGAETILETNDPLVSFTALMRLLAGPFDDIPAVLDTNSMRWHPRDVLDEEFLVDHIEPPEDVLWIIHVVTREGSRGDGTWVHTHGLWRCGKPELEMLEVPAGQSGRAAELLNALAGRLLEEKLPDPDESFEVGNDLEITLRRWEEVVEKLPEDSPGSMKDRDDELHNGPRAVVCRKGGNTWPPHVVERIGRGDRVVFLSNRCTARAAHRARATWPQLAMTFASLSPPLLRCDADGSGERGEPFVRFILKTGLVASDEPSVEREHVWFVARRFDGDRAEGQLVNQPILVKNLKQGDIAWISRAKVSDWSVVTPVGIFGPSRIGALVRAVDRLRLDRR